MATPILLRRKDGIIQKYYFKNRQKALNHPQRPTRQQLRQFRRQQRKKQPPSAPTPPRQPPLPPTQPRPPSSGPTQPPVRDPGEGLRRRRGAEYSTWFMASGAGLEYVVEREGRPEVDFTSPDLLDALRRDLDVDEYSVPLAFASNHGMILGQVRWEGIVRLDSLIRDLNLQLQAEGTEVSGFDFRDVYPVWSYTYKVIETIGGVDFVVPGSETEGHS